MTAWPTLQDGTEVAVWVLVCNPSEEAWDFDGPGTDRWWLDHNYRRDLMHEGQLCTIWVTGDGPRAGFIAVGEIAGDTYDDGVDNHGRPRHWVPVRNVVVFDEPLLIRQDVLETPGLASFELAQRGARKNPSYLTPAEGQVLLALLDDDDTDDGTETAALAAASAEARKAVEDAAMAAVSTALEADNWTVKDVHLDNLGWDLTATRGSEQRLVEVKGRASTQRWAVLSRNEHAKAGTEADWRLAIVTTAVTAPEIHWRTGSEVTATATPESYRVSA